MPFVKVEHLTKIGKLLNLNIEQVTELYKNWQFSDPYRQDWAPEEEKVVFEFLGSRGSMTTLSKLLNRHYSVIKKKTQERDVNLQRDKFVQRLSKKSAQLRGYIKKHCGMFRLLEDCQLGTMGEAAYRFDYYLPQLKLAFEYDGEQHDQFVEIWHKDARGLKLQQNRDRIKDRICEKAGVTLIRFSWKESLTELLFIKKLDEVLKQHYAQRRNS